MPKNGKPYKFTKRKRREFIKLLAKGGRRSLSAEAVGVTRQCVSYTAERHPEFAKAIDEAEMRGNELVEDALFGAALNGHVTACQVWLYNRCPDQWSDRRVSMAHRLTQIDGDKAKIEEVYLEAPIDVIIKARAIMEELRQVQQPDSAVIETTKIENDESAE